MSFDFANSSAKTLTRPNSPGLPVASLISNQPLPYRSVHSAPNMKLRKASVVIRTFESIETPFVSVSINVSQSD